MSTGEAMIPTARGDSVRASELGFTLSGELIIQETPEMSINWPDYSWGGRPEEERIASVVSILNHAYEHGVTTIMDRTVVGTGRNIPRLKRIALQTRLNIVPSTGIYVLFELPYYFHYRARFPEQYGSQLTLADFFVRDIEKGVMDTGVRCGCIKVLSDQYGIEETPDVRRVFAATAEAHRRTGAPIVTHTVGVFDTLRQQKVLAEDGVDLSRVMFGHQDRTGPHVPLSEFQRALDEGSMLSFDLWGPGGKNVLGEDTTGLQDSLQRIVSLINKGYGKQLMLSSGWPIAFNDAFGKDFMPEEGIKPFMSVHAKVIPGLRALGVSEAGITALTVTNPQSFLSTLAKGGY